MRELRGRAGRRRIVCVSGGTCFTHPDTGRLVGALAASRRSIVHDTLVVTCGMGGVQRAFAEHCVDGSRLWNLVPVGESSGFGVGTDVPVGKHLEDTADIFARLGEVYIVVEGGPSVNQQARTSVASGALVLPVARSGGASAGMFDFPTSALKRPVHATFEQWRLLWDVSAPVENTAAAVSAIVATALRDGAGITSNSRREERTGLPWSLCSLPALLELFFSSVLPSSSCSLFLFCVSLRGWGGVGDVEVLRTKTGRREGEVDVRLSFHLYPKRNFDWETPQDIKKAIRGCQPRWECRHLTMSSIHKIVVCACVALSQFEKNRKMENMKTLKTYKNEIHAAILRCSRCLRCVSGISRFAATHIKAV